MKLIDLLANELTTWPEQGPGCNYCVANSLGEVFFGNGSHVQLSQAPEDHETARVTRAQWQATGWTGEDGSLPPVGTVCEVQHESWARSIWEKRTILWLGNRTVVTQDAAGEEKNGFIHKLTFRPIRTAEQIAAKERETAIDEMVRTALHQSYVITPVQAKIVFERIYDAGYRKAQS